MDNQKISSEISQVSAQTASNSVAPDYLKPTKDVVVIEPDVNGESPYLKSTNIVGVGQVKELCNLKNDTRYILKVDAYLLGGISEHDSIEMVLDGGNLYRYENVKYIPSKIVSINGSFIDVSETRDRKVNPQGLAASHFIEAGENTSFKKMGPQTNYTVEFNMMDFVHSEDYDYSGPSNTARSIRLNAVLKRIFDSLYNDYVNGGQRMVVKMPETHFGSINFFIDRPIDIPHNVTIDLSGAKVYIQKDFKKTKVVNGAEVEVDYQNEPFGSNYVFSFDTNETYPNLATSVVKNAEIVLDSNLIEEDNCPTVIFNLTHFSGIMENVTINLSNSLKCVALWQPFGTPNVTYSDRKILRRCKVSNVGWRTDTPSVILCYGDGCIIEQCILGYVAIICGNSYTIKGCLNDSYFLYDTTVDFSGSYWEISQFQILDSNVRFATSKLNCQNNNFNTRNSTNIRHYVGPWMSVDTDDCRKRILNIREKFNIGDANFNEIKTVDTSNQYYRNYMGRATSRHSTVSFDPTIRSQQIYWGYRQPMSGPLLKVGDNARIIGIENLESIPSIFIHNSLHKETHFTNKNTGEVSINTYNAATIPLVNGDFFNLGKDIAVPTKSNVTVEVGQSQTALTNVDTEKMGCNWTSDSFKNFVVRILIDRKRNLYSETFTGSNIYAVANKELYVSVLANMASTEYKNLMVELTFERNGNKYTMRQHFSRAVAGDLLSFGDETLKPAGRGDVEIAKFIIAKVPNVFSTDEIWEQTENGKLVVEKPKDAENICNPTQDTLCDYQGNMYEPDKDNNTNKSENKSYTVATRLVHIGENNVRAYVSELPPIEGWNDGDEVVVAGTANRGLYILDNGSWHQIASL